MQKPPDATLLPFPPAFEEGEAYDLDYLQNVIRALDFLRRDARNTGIEEIASMIDSTFRIIYTTYYILMRHQLAEKLSS